MARAKRTARADARRRYRADHPLGSEGFEDADDPAEAAEVSSSGGRQTSARAPGSGNSGKPARAGGLRAFREAYQPADIRADLRALPQLLLSRAVALPALLVAISAVILVVAVQTAPATASVPGASASPGASAAAVASPAPSAAASPAPSDAATAGTTTISGSPLGVIASILALLFLGIPSPPAIGGIYLAAILAKRSSYLAGGIAGLIGSVGALAAVIAISPDQVSASLSFFPQIFGTSIVYGLVIGAGLGYYRRLLRLMNPTPTRPTGRSRQPARRR